MSNTKINQLSEFTPAICSHNGLLHAVFVAANPSHELLHIVSSDGVVWERKNNVRQSTKFAPAIVDFGNKLRIVFVANNDTNTLLTCTYDDGGDIWTDNTPLGESSSAGPALEVVGGPAIERLVMCFVANNSSNDLLVTEIDSFNVPFK